MAAHNEEKIIKETLENLSKLPWDNYEVILGLDGCTDNTEEIVKKYVKKDSKKFKYFKLNLRSGKPAVINNIIKHASGEIVVINDADWIFRVANKKSLSEFISIFENQKIGGIAESFPVEWDLDKIKRGNLGLKMVAYSSYFWLNFQKERYTKKEGKVLYLTSSKMFLTNVFRRKLYQENSSLGDDFERTFDIMKEGYSIAIPEKITGPRMVAVYDNVSVRDLLKQKIRTSIARKQIADEGEKLTLTGYYIPAVGYIFRNSWKMGIGVGFIVSLWLGITVFGTMLSHFKKMDTKKGWTLRMRR